MTRTLGAIKTRCRKLATSGAWSEHNSRHAGWLRFKRSSVEKSIFNVEAPHARFPLFQATLFVFFPAAGTGSVVATLQASSTAPFLYQFRCLISRFHPPSDYYRGHLVVASAWQVFVPRGWCPRQSFFRNACAVFFADRFWIAFETLRDFAF